MDSKTQSNPVSKEEHYGTRILDATGEVVLELSRAISNYPSMLSPHEGWAIIHEELEELWELVRKQQAHHDLSAMRKEACQIAAMGIRFMVDLT
jgi:hypothetical protein